MNKYRVKCKMHKLKKFNHFCVSQETSCSRTWCAIWSVWPLPAPTPSCTGCWTTMSSRRPGPSLTSSRRSFRQETTRKNLLQFEWMSSFRFKDILYISFLVFVFYPNRISNELLPLYLLLLIIHILHTGDFEWKFNKHIFNFVLCISFTSKIINKILNQKVLFYAISVALA